MKLVTKKCPNCGASLDFDSALETAVCCYCDSVVVIKKTPKKSDTFIQYIPPKKRTKPGWLKAILFFLVMVLVAFGVLFLVIFIIVLNSEDYDSDSSSSTVSVNVTPTRAPDAEETFVYDPGEAFVFDNYEITISGNMIWLESESSDEDDPDFSEYTIKLPITLTNLSDETRMFSWSTMNIYGSSGLALRRAFSFQHDDSIEFFLSDMRGGATSSDMYLYFPYDGDGYYYISFSKWEEATREVKIHISA